MQNKRVFDPASPGFLYTIVTAFLGICAAFGVQFPDTVANLGTQITTTLSTGGVWAVSGIILASVFFPIWNRWKSGGPFMASTLTWIAVANIGLSVVALTGLTIPVGSVEQIVGFIQAKDYFALGGFFLTTILPAIVRFIKSKNQPNITTTAGGSGPSEIKWYPE